MRSLFYIAWAIVGAAVSAASADQPKASAFGRLPAIADAAISPNGKKIAVLGNEPGQPILTINTLDSKDSVSVGLGDIKVRSISWADDKRLIVGVTIVSKPPGFDLKYSFDRDLIVGEDTKIKGMVLSNGDDSAWFEGRPILKILKQPKLTAIVQVGHALYDVNLDNGDGALRGDSTASSFALDRLGHVRARYGRVGFETDEIVGNSPGALFWRNIARRPVDKTNDLELYGYSDTEDAVYWSVEDSAGEKFYRTTLKDGVQTQIGKDLSPGASWMIWDRERNQPLGFATETDRRQYVWTDPEIGGAYAKLSRAFKGRDVSIHGWSDDRNRMIFSVETDNSAPSWFLFEASRGEVSPLGESYPELANVALGTTTWLTYKARDGLSIPAYLTVPPGAAGAKLPLIVMPHGGPASRDRRGFDWWVQFLVSRGYAVLQPQFRGSNGFGAEFRNAGEGHWGDLMQTDLLDGVAHLAAQGVIDPKRVCIVGASYGGFAALAGVTLFPDSYRCAVSVAGVSDPLNLIGDRHLRYGRGSAASYWHEQIGADDYKKALALSPVHNAENVKAPVLLIHGEDDTTVPFHQSEVMASALIYAGKDVTFLKLKGDDHYLSSSATRTGMLEAVDTFLKRVMPAGPTP